MSATERHDEKKPNIDTERRRRSSTGARRSLIFDWLYTVYIDGRSDFIVMTSINARVRLKKMTQHQKCDYSVNHENFCAKFCTLVGQGPVH